jgi:hypothetical protein
MRRPIDPRNNGKKPEKVHAKASRLTLADLDDDLEHKVSLLTVINAWSKAVKDHESQGHRVIEGPNFDSSTFYGSSLALSYTYEWDNLTYEQEKAEWDARIVKFEKELIEWNAFEEERKKGLVAAAKNIDLQILRTEHRLANLKAVKAREPIPFPEG